jgi:hypothetical protein
MNFDSSSSFIRHHTSFNGLLAHQCYADKALTPLKLTLCLIFPCWLVINGSVHVYFWNIYGYVINLIITCTACSDTSELQRVGMCKLNATITPETRNLTPQASHASGLGQPCDPLAEMTERAISLGPGHRQRKYYKF